MLGGVLYTLTQSGAILADIENAERVLKTCQMPHILQKLKPYLWHFSDQFAELVQLPHNAAMHSYSLANADLFEGGNYFARAGINISNKLHAAVASNDQESKMEVLGGMYACFLLASIFRLQRHLNKVSGFASERLRLTIRQLRKTMNDAISPT